MVVRVAGGCVGLQVYLAHWGAVYPPPLKDEMGVQYSPIRLLAIYLAVLTPVEMRWEGKGRMVDFAEFFVLPACLFCFFLFLPLILL